MMDTNKLRELAQAATPGPWKVTKKNPYVTYQNGPDSSTQLWQPYDEYYHPGAWIDAEYIASADPDTMLELINEIDALRARCAALEASGDEMANRLKHTIWALDWEGLKDQDDTDALDAWRKLRGK